MTRPVDMDPASDHDPDAFAEQEAAIVWGRPVDECLNASRHEGLPGWAEDGLCPRCPALDLTPDGRGLRCPVCRCGVKPTHVPGSAACQAAADERDWSQTRDDD